MPDVRPYRVAGLVVTPPGSTADNGVITLPDGSMYQVGPALYRLAPAAPGTHATVLGGRAEQESPQYDVEFVPPEAWPAELLLDNAVVSVVGPPVEAAEPT